MLTKRHALCAVEVGKKIYAIGGTIDHYPFISGINTVYAYDPVADPISIHYVF